MSQNRQISQRSLILYYNSTKYEDQIEQLLLTIKIGQNMTYSPAERVTCPHVTQCNNPGWQK